MKEGRGTIRLCVGSFLLGALILSLLSIPQKMALGADPFALRGFVVPFLFGGFTGLLLGLAKRKLQRENQKLKTARDEFQRRDRQYQAYFDNHHSPMLLINSATADIVDANSAACTFYGYGHEALVNMKISDINTLSKEDVFKEMAKATSRNRKYFNFRHRLANKEVRDVEVYSGPIELGEQQLLYSVIHDVTERKKTEAEREQLIADLQEALSQIKTLRGLLPICANCKKIRDDSGYWRQIEDYIGQHSEAEFSHSICPDCLTRFYSDLAKE